MAKHGRRGWLGAMILYLFTHAPAYGARVVHIDHRQRHILLVVEKGEFATFLHQDQVQLYDERSHTLLQAQVLKLSKRRARLAIPDLERVKPRQRFKVSPLITAIADDDKAEEDDNESEVPPH